MEGEKEIRFGELLGKVDTYIYIMLAIFLVSFLIRIYFANHCLWIDEGRELNIARSFLRTGHFLDLGKEWTQHPLLFYVLIAISYLFFGITEYAGEFVVILLGSLTIPLVYLIGKELYSKKTGLIAAFLMAVHPLHWFLSERILTDVPNTFFITLSICLFVLFIKRKENKFLYATAIATALAVLTRMTSAVLILIFLVYLYYKSGFKILKEKKYWYSLLIFLLIFSTWMIRNLLVIGQPIDISIYIAHITTRFDVQPWYYYLVNFSDIVRLPFAILFLWGLVCLVLRKFKGSELLILWIILILIAISIISVKVPRYLLPIIPAIVLIGGYGLEKIIKDLRKFPKSGVYFLIFIIVMYTGYVSISEGHNLIVNKATTFCGLREAGTWIKQSGISGGIMAGSTKQMAFYADNENVIPFPENEKEVIKKIREKDISFVVVDVWERTQPRYVFTYFNQHNDSFRPVFAYPGGEKNFVIVFQYLE